MNNSIFANVYNLTGQLVEGPIPLKSATVTKVIDGAGTISFDTGLSETRARELFTPNRRVDLVVDKYGLQRVVGRGFIRKITKSVSSNDYTIQCSGPDLIGALDRQTSTLNTILATDFASAVSTILGSAGWVSDIEGTWGDVSLEIDTESILTTILAAVQSVGAHSRIGSDFTTLNIGAFGNASGVLVTNQTIASDEVNSNTDILLIRSIQEIEDSDQLVNFLVPIGKGVSGEALTLQHSTNPGVNNYVDGFGNVIYYIGDLVSISQYGVSELTKPFRNITPLDDTPANLELAANALYEAAKSWMDRHNAPQKTYSIEAVKIATDLRPGDLVRVFFDGFIRSGSEELELLRVDGNFYVMKVIEKYGEEDSISLDVSSIDRITIKPETAIARSIQTGSWSEKELMKSKPNGLLPLSDLNVSSPPTSAQITSAFGTPASVGDGFIGIIDDNGAGTTLWICVAKNSGWFYQQMTKAV